jgi:hypothetical protein
MKESLFFLQFSAYEAVVSTSAFIYFLRFLFYKLEILNYSFCPTSIDCVIGKDTDVLIINHV